MADPAVSDSACRVKCLQIGDCFFVMEHLLPHYADIESVHQTGARPELGYFAVDKFVLSPGRDTASVDSNTRAVTGQATGAPATILDNGKSIAVMPLVNMSSHEENAYFVGGIHEDVLTNLSRIENLEVVSRTSMLKYAASEMTLNVAD